MPKPWRSCVMKWISNILTKEIPAYTIRGFLIGRPQPHPGSRNSIDDMERNGYAGVYEPDPDPRFIVTMYGPNGPVNVNIGPGQQIDASRNPPAPVTVDIDFELAKLNDEELGKIIKSVEAEPESDLDNRIKECQRAKPAKYRARWTGTKYVYEPLDNS